jgi:hypothetical protein
MVKRGREQEGTDEITSQVRERAEETLPRRRNSLCVMQKIEEDRQEGEGVDDLDIRSPLQPKLHIVCLTQRLVQSSVVARGAPPSLVCTPPWMVSTVPGWR